MTTCSPPGGARSPASPASRVYLIVIDEYAYFSATVGIKKDREDFAALTRDLVARGRAAGVIIILATQRPSHQVIDPSMRDLFGYRWAFRCTTDCSSDTVLGQGWASRGLHRRRHRPAGPRRRLAAVRDRHPAPDQGRLPHRRRHQVPGRLRGPAARPRTPHEPPARPERATRHITSGQLWLARTPSRGPLTPNRARRLVENDEYAAFARRVLRAYARRVAPATSTPSPS